MRIEGLKETANRHFTGVDRRRVPPSAAFAPGSRTLRQLFMEMVLGQRVGFGPDGPFHTIKAPSEHGDYGPPAWVEYLQEHQSDYPYVTGDTGILKLAIARGLVERLPPRIMLIEWGCGGVNGFQKTRLLIDAITQSDSHEIAACAFVDTVPSFAQESAQLASAAYGIPSHPVVGDFTKAGDINVPKLEGCTPVVVCFGGPFANAPDERNAGGLGPKDNAAMYCRMANAQNGQGSRLLLTYQCDKDPERLTKQYRPTKAFERFIFSPLAWAVEEGVISRSYDPHDYWRMTTAYDKENEAVRLQATCKKEHHLLTAREGQIIMEENDSLTMLLSGKWSAEAWNHVLSAAGYSVSEDCIFEEETHGLILAEAVRPWQPS